MCTGQAQMPDLVPLERALKRKEGKITWGMLCTLPQSPVGVTPSAHSDSWLDSLPTALPMSPGRIPGDHVPNKYLHSNSCLRFTCYSLVKMLYYLFSGQKKQTIDTKISMGDLKYILLSERSQSEKATNYMIPFMWHPRKSKATETNQWLPWICKRVRVD